MDLLLGLDYVGYLPKVEKIQAYILLLRSQFCSGRLVFGRLGLEEVVDCDPLLVD